MAVVPLQDLLKLGSEARMNYPSRAEGNWQWRFRQPMLGMEVSSRLRELALLYGRSEPEPESGPPCGAVRASSGAGSAPPRDRLRRGDVNPLRIGPISCMMGRAEVGECARRLKRP